MSNGTKVVKRNGTIEPLDLDKMHLMVEEACRGLAGVSASQVEMTSGIQFYDGISTEEIQEILIRSASDLIDLDHPNYQFVAARLLLFSVRKQLYGKMKELPALEHHIYQCVNHQVYDNDIFDKYSKEEIERADSYIDHDRDYLFTYAGLRQVVDKYLVQDRSGGGVYETPQFMYMMIALTIFAEYPKETRMSYVRRYYDAISKHKINIPTPIMAGVRTPLRQFASCVLVDIDDTLDSIFSSDMAIGRYVSQRAGIGINAGRIRGINSKIRGGEVQHTGVVPFLKKFEATVRCCTQNGIRGGSATVHFPIWHQEIEDILVLKNNKGTEDNRVRKLDYSIQLSKIFYERFIQDSEITLFSPHDVPGLYDAFGTDTFDNLYTVYEKDTSIPKKTVKAQELILSLLKERAETGRIYIMNIDHCNSHSSYKDQITMSNLCQEITEPTTPIQHIDDDGPQEIATCILSAINVGKVKSDDELEELCNLSVRALEEIIDYQNYPVKAAENFTKRRRSLGIGYIGLAHYLAKLGFNYDSQGAWDAVHGLSESFQYYLLKASNQIAKEKGHCEYFGRTKYADGILPIDTYKKDVDRNFIHTTTT
jgi:ribonucleoside-diphosphate reductase alpha chain